MRTTMLTAAGAVLLISAPAFAGDNEPFVLDLEQLDQVTAGAGRGAPAHDHANEVQVVVFTPGKLGLFNHITHSTGTDINTHVIPGEGVFVINPSGAHGTPP
jgi:hypothetical protein